MIRLFPKPRLDTHTKRRLPREQRMTIAVHLLAGGGSLLTATDTQDSYSDGAKVDAGKIAGAWRADPSGAINIAGAGDVPQINTLTQEVIRHFQRFEGTAEQLERQIGRIVRAFYRTHIFPLLGRVDEDAV